MYFAAKTAAKSLTKQIHTEAQKSKLDPRTWLKEYSMTEEYDPVANIT